MRERNEQGKYIKTGIKYTIILRVNDKERIDVLLKRLS